MFIIIYSLVDSLTLTLYITVHDTSQNGAVTGGVVVAVLFIMSVTGIVIVALVLRHRQRSISARTHKKYAIPSPTTCNVMYNIIMSGII